MTTHCMLSAQTYRTYPKTSSLRNFFALIGYEAQNTRLSLYIISSSSPYSIVAQIILGRFFHFMPLRNTRASLYSLNTAKAFDKFWAPALQEFINNIVKDNTCMKIDENRLHVATCSSYFFFQSSSQLTAIRGELTVNVALCAKFGE